MKVPIQPRKRFAEPISHVTNSGLNTMLVTAGGHMTVNIQWINTLGDRRRHVYYILLYIKYIIYIYK